MLMLTRGVKEIERTLRGLALQLWADPSIRINAFVQRRDGGLNRAAYVPAACCGVSDNNTQWPTERWDGMLGSTGPPLPILTNVEKPHAHVPSVTVRYVRSSVRTDLLVFRYIIRILERTESR